MWQVLHGAPDLWESLKRSMGLYWISCSFTACVQCQRHVLPVRELLTVHLRLCTSLKQTHNMTSRDTFWNKPWGWMSLQTSNAFCILENLRGQTVETRWSVRDLVCIRSTFFSLHLASSSEMPYWVGHGTLTEGKFFHFFHSLGTF